MKQLAIFDLDGTLLNTIADLAACTNYTLKQFGYPEQPESAYHAFVGNGINKLLERAMPAEERTEEKILEMRNVFVPYYNRHNRDFTKPYPGVITLLKQLKNNGVTLAIASNKYQQGTEELVQHYFPEITFAAVLGQREGIPVKPNPTIVEEILQITKIEKEACIYIGDSPIDMQTAKNADVQAIGVSWGFRPIEELQVYKPKYVVNSAKQIEEIIQNSII